MFSSHQSKSVLLELSVKVNLVATTKFPVEDDPYLTLLTTIGSVCLREKFKTTFSPEHSNPGDGLNVTNVATTDHIDQIEG